MEAKQKLSEVLSSFEFFDRQSLDLVLKHAPHIKFPLECASDFNVLIETSGSNREHDQEKLETFLESLMENNSIVDGTIAQDVTQANAIWSIREGIPEACSKSGSVYKYDVSMPVPLLYQLVDDMRKRLTEKGILGRQVNSVIGFGHVGDGNLHLNITAEKYSQEVMDAIEPFVYQWIQKVGGSISAEHGLGVMKREYITYSKSPEMVGAMRKIKTLFDPNSILNPYKYFPE